MAEQQKGNERTRLAVLLAVLAVAVIVAVVHFLGGGGIGGGGSQSGDLDYEARNLQLLETDTIGRGEELQTEAGGNPFAFRPPPTPTPNLTPPPTAVPRPTLPPRPTPTPRIAVGENGEILPPPPPFDREYIGHFGPRPTQVAAFRRKGEDSSTEIDVAIVGTVLDGVFIVREIGLESVVIGFVGYAPSEDTRVPLSEN
jgi:hypothetical protein